MSEVSSKPREVVQVAEAVEQAEGQGARVRRIIGTRQLPRLDPFLMLDHFMVKKPGGFPNHPHRGFETVTYMDTGAFTHEDFCGHKGTIYPGDLQWMTAGRGIVHSELPATDGLNSGLQLWINLARKDKMIPPKYQELLNKDIPVKTVDGVTAKVIAGSALGIDSPVYTLTPTMYLDYRVEPNKSHTQAVPEGYNAFVYIMEGLGYFGTEKTLGKTHHLLVLSPGTDLYFETKDEPVRFILIGGQPIGEPVVQQGPFVLTTRQELMDTFRDYQLGINGFENRPED